MNNSEPSVFAKRNPVSPTAEIVDGSISCDKAIAPFTSSAEPVVGDAVFAPIFPVVVIFALAATGPV